MLIAYDVFYVSNLFMPFLECCQFLDELPTHKNPYSRLEIPPIKLPVLEPNYGRYRGSLTTPPCSETVIWTIMLWNVSFSPALQTVMFTQEI
jgi:carbonic anhydrase